MKKLRKEKGLVLTKSLSFTASDVTVAVQLMSELLNFEFVRSLNRLHVTLVQDEQLPEAVLVELTLMIGFLGYHHRSCEQEDGDDRQNDEDDSGDQHEHVIHVSSLVGVIMGHVEYAKHLKILELQDDKYNDICKYQDLYKVHKQQH